MEAQMNWWQRSVAKIQTRKQQVTECERGLEALSKVTACFQQMATSVGSHSDSSSLREEMNDTRTLAHRVCTGLHKRLVPLLTDTVHGQEDRDKMERLWVHFLTGLETLQQELHKFGYLTDRFPLKEKNDHRALVKTGASDEFSRVAAQSASIQTPWVGIEVEQKPDLQTHITQIEAMMKEMLQKVSIPFWAVESTQEAWTEGVEFKDAEDDQDKTLEEIMEVEVVSQDGKMSGCCHPPNCKFGCMFCLLT